MYCLKITQRLAVRLSWIPWLILSLSAPDLGASPLEKNAKKSDGIGRNVVLLVTDDQGLDAGCYGNAVIKTPNMDALARDGTCFTHAFCTTASCSASRSVILTGLHNHANGQYGHQHAYHKLQLREHR